MRAPLAMRPSSRCADAALPPPRAPCRSADQPEVHAVIPITQSMDRRHGTKLCLPPPRSGQLLLVEAEADAFVQAANGRTALMEAARAGSSECCELLLTVAGVDVRCAWHVVVLPCKRALQQPAVLIVNALRASLREMHSQSHLGPLRQHGRCKRHAPTPTVPGQALVAAAACLSTCSLRSTGRPVKKMGAMLRWRQPSTATWGPCKCSLQPQARRLTRRIRQAGRACSSQQGGKLGRGVG